MHGHLFRCFIFGGGGHLKSYMLLKGVLESLEEGCLKLGNLFMCVWSLV